MSGRRTGVVASALIAISVFGGVPVASGGSPLLVGAVEDAAKWSLPAAKMNLARSAGFGAVRMTVQWSTGQTVPNGGDLQNTLNAANAARAAGIEPIVAIYNVGSSSTPNTPELRAQFAQFAAAVARGLPPVRRFIVGNEPNINRYWLPQFNADGTDAAAPAYEALLAASYDAIKAARRDAVVIGGAVSPRGEDSATSTRPTHSPTLFIQDLGAAFKASGRASRIMDAFDQHVYQDYSALPPSYEHPNSRTIAVPDYGKLVSALGNAFAATTQPGSTLPILYGEFGVESIIPAAKAALYTGTEVVATKPVDEPTQAAYYTEAFKLAMCQPNVIGLLVFHVSDEPALAAWQSGPYYADDTPKTSLPGIRDAAAAARAGTLTTCPDRTPPTLALTAPAAGRTLHGTITLSANASDNVGIGKVEFLVNGTVVGSKAVKPYSISWNSSAMNGRVSVTARAQDAAHNLGTSAAVSVTLDNTPPETVITASPGPISSETATFQFSSTETSSTFACSLDGGAYTSCSSPKTYTGLIPGPHTFSVRATDAVGNVDPTPALYAWTSADTTPPETTITAAPASSSYTTSASFSFASNERATFACALDSAPYAACSSPATYAGLGLGPHSFHVRATDTAGHVDATPAAWSWTVRPANDPFAAARVLATATGTTTGTSSFASKEPGEPNHAGYVGGHSIWFRWTAPATGAIAFDTAGSGFDTVLAVYRGTSISALAAVGSNNDASSSTRTSRVKFNVSAGVTYTIAVDGVSGAAGAVALNWR